MAPDAPDDEFFDANCDGIDGDASRGVFVSPEGADEAPGTLEQPVATISRALTIAGQKQFDVYVCNGTYRDNVVIGAGVNVFGGYDCSRNWVRVKDRAVVQPVSGLPLLIDSVSAQVSIDRLAFRSGNARNAGESSQAGGIINSKQVRLSHVEFLAGDGAKGAPGVAGAPAPKEPPRAGVNGADGSLTSCATYSESTDCTAMPSGGAAVWNECPFNGGTYKTIGGPGGPGLNPWMEQGQAACLNYVNYDADFLPGDVGAYNDGSGLRFRGQEKDVEAGASGGGAALGIGKLSGVLYVASNAGAPGATAQAPCCLAAHARTASISARVEARVASAAAAAREAPVAWRGAHRSRSSW
jgi:hypothetical protein